MPCNSSETFSDTMPATTTPVAPSTTPAAANGRVLFLTISPTTPQTDASGPSTSVTTPTMGTRPRRVPVTPSTREATPHEFVRRCGVSFWSCAADDADDSGDAAPITGRPRNHDSYQAPTRPPYPNRARTGPGVVHWIRPAGTTVRPSPLPHRIPISADTLPRARRMAGASLRRPRAHDRSCWWW